MVKEGKARLMRRKLVCLPQAETYHNASLELLNCCTGLDANVKRRWNAVPPVCGLSRPLSFSPHYVDFDINGFCPGATAIDAPYSRFLAVNFAAVSSSGSAPNSTVANPSSSPNPSSSSDRCMMDPRLRPTKFSAAPCLLCASSREQPLLFYRFHQFFGEFFSYFYLLGRHPDHTEKN